MTIHRVRMCTCGHDESWHADGGPCTYGRGHAMGGCSCEGFSRRKRAAVTIVPSTAPPRAGLLAAIDDVVAALAKLRAELAATSAPPKVIRRRPADPIVRATNAPRAENDAKLGRCERAILTVLAQHGSRTKVQVAILAGYSHTSGGFRNAISALRTAGLVAGGGDALVSFTRKDAAGSVGPHGGAPILAMGRSSTVCWVFHLHELERVGR